MSLNIKNERVHRLAKEAARRTGKSQTSVVEDALVALLSRLDATGSTRERADDVRRLLAQVDDRLGDDGRTALLRGQDELYDEEGLPA